MPNIYLELSEEFEELLADNRITIKDILDHSGIEVEGVTQEIIPYQADKGARTKDIVTIISVAIASSVVVEAIAFAISQVLYTLHYKPLVEIYENEELRDKDGNLQLKSVKRYEFPFSKAEQRLERELKFSSGFKNGIVIKIESFSQSVSIKGNGNTTTTINVQNQLTRYTNITFPEECILYQCELLKLQLTIDPEERSVIVSKFQIPYDVREKEILLSVLVLSEGFSIDNPIKHMNVPLLEDSEELIFEATPIKLGRQIIEVEFYKGADRIGYVTLKAQVAKYETEFTNV